MQTENDTSKPEASPKHKIGEGCSRATYPPSFPLPTFPFFNEMIPFDPPIPIILLLETAILRIAFAQDEQKARGLKTPYIENALGRWLQVDADRLFQNEGMTEILEFCAKFWGYPILETSSPSTPNRSTKSMNQNQTESKPPSVEEPRDEGLDETPWSSSWMPIETAPRDGTEILGFGPPPDDESVSIVQTRWRDFSPLSQSGKLFELGEGPRGQFEVTIRNFVHRWKPTHWMRLTSPPNASLSHGDESEL